MEGKLLWSLDDNVFTSRIPTNHMMIFRTFEETRGLLVGDYRNKKKKGRYAYSFVRNVACGFGSGFGDFGGLGGWSSELVLLEAEVMDGYKRWSRL
jgi:hypothetical protein